jgi:hypothetical protein
MRKIERRLCILAIAFVVMYIAAIIVSVSSQHKVADRTAVIVSTRTNASESKVMLAELLLPMSILLTVTICFIIAKKKRAKAEILLNADDEVDFENEHSMISNPNALTNEKK